MSSPRESEDNGKNENNQSDDNENTDRNQDVDHINEGETNNNATNDNNNNITKNNEDHEINESHDENLASNNKLSIHDIHKYQLPLQNRWTLWHTSSSSGESGGWSNNYKKICDFDTVGAFWRLFNNIVPPSMCAIGSSYYLFKGCVKPEWEDEYNASGGACTYRYGTDDDRDFWDFTWFHVALNMIGNNFTHTNEINGLIISIRKNGRGKLELWYRNASNDAIVNSIGKEFKQFIGVNKNNVISYSTFNTKPKK